MAFRDKVILVTGSSSGIGAEIARAFGREGAKVAIVGRNEKKLAEVEATFDDDRSPLVIKADITDDTQAERTVQQTIDHFGKLDVLVNNAGIAATGNILDGNLLQAYDQTMAINLRSTIHLTMLATSHLIKSKGNIVNISGVWGIGTPKLSQAVPSAISKAGMNHFTKAAALELAPHGVRVNAVSPGPVDTDIIKRFAITWDDIKSMTALKRLSDKSEIADLVLFIAGEKGKSLTGSNYVIDNGMLLM